MATVQNQPITNSLLSNMNGTKASNKASGSSGAAGASDTSSATSTQAMTNDFMTMLIAQMKYQDPTKPVDSAQMTSQLAQISTVDGINRLGSQAAGNVPLTWSGTDANGNALPNGRYSFQVQALSNGKPVAASPLQYSTVQSISASNGGVTLNLDDKSSIGATSVLQII